MANANDGGNRWLVADVSRAKSGFRCAEIGDVGETADIPRIGCIRRDVAHVNGVMIRAAPLAIIRRVAGVPCLRVQ